VLDAAKGIIDTPAMGLIGGMRDQFAIERPTWAEWVKAGKV